VEKRKPHFDLATIKATFAKVETLRMTKTSQDCAFALGLLLQDVVDLIQTMTREQFYKSMTSAANSAIWQDVYHVPWNTTLLYVKFTTDAEGYLIISLKEK
jgi:motility quorum-sensing regulator / GCU-specific mRNA interferase toxin